MKKLITIAGATGNLGGRVASSLRKRKAAVRALVRPGTEANRFMKLKQQGIEILEVDLNDSEATARACEDSSCVVSTLLGVEPTMIGTQSALLHAAVCASVPRLIPSDYAMDFTTLRPGLNRNLDLLTDEAPLVLRKINRVLY